MIRTKRVLKELNDLMANKRRYYLICKNVLKSHKRESNFVPKTEIFQNKHVSLFTKSPLFCVNMFCIWQQQKVIHVFLQDVWSEAWFQALPSHQDAGGVSPPWGEELPGQRRHLWQTAWGCFSWWTEMTQSYDQTYVWTIFLKVSNKAVLYKLK